MKFEITFSHGIAALSLVAIGTWLASAAGPAPSCPGATIINSLPYAVTTPGTYCLGANLTAGPSDSISIDVNDVVLDFAGFRISGPGFSTPSRAIRGFGSRIEIRNGTLLNFGDSCIALFNSIEVRNMNFTACGDGIVTGPQSVIENCDFTNILGRAVFAGRSSRVVDCQVTQGQAGTGISVGDASYVARVDVKGGERAIECGPGARVEHCSATDFTGVGFDVGGGSLVDGCYVKVGSEGALVGIFADSNSLVTDCAVLGNLGTGVGITRFSTVARTRVQGASSAGIEALDSSRVTDCTVTLCGEGGGATATGIRAKENVVVEGTISSLNLGPGLRYLEEGGSVARSSFHENQSDGVHVIGDTAVRDSHFAGNAGAGIRVVGDGALIQDNQVDGNVWGILTEGRGCLVTGNRARGNQADDYDLHWATSFGPLVDGYGPIQDAKPHANFEASR